MIKRIVSANSKLCIVFTAFALTYFVEIFSSNAEYYLFSSIAFAMISIISSIAACRLKSKILFCYAMVNLFAAFINWFMAIPEGYDFFRHFYWYATINFSLIFLAVELMVILDGSRDAFNFIHNQPNTNRSQRNNLEGFVEGTQ